MRFYLGLAFAALLAAPTVFAQRSTLNDLPTCANGCANTAASNAKCTLSDSSAPCLCFSNFRDDVVKCAQSACTVEDRGSVQGVMDTFCNGVSPPITGSNSTSAAASSTKSSASASSTSSKAQPSTSGPLTTRPSATATSNTQGPANTPSTTPVSTTIAGSISFGSGLQTSVVIVTGSATTDDGGAVPTAPATNGALTINMGGVGAVIMIVLSIASQLMI